MFSNNWLYNHELFSTQVVQKICKMDFVDTMLNEHFYYIWIIKNLETTTYNIYTSVAQLPEGWDEVAIQNTFLQSAYLKVLETSAPKNMQCFFIGVFEKSELIGVVLAQYLNLTKLESYFWIILWLVSFEPGS